VVAKEVLGMVGRGEPVSKAVAGCHPWQEQALVEVSAVLVGVMCMEG